MELRQIWSRELLTGLCGLCRVNLRRSVRGEVTAGAGEQSHQCAAGGSEWSEFSYGHGVKIMGFPIVQVLIWEVLSLFSK